jgi:hypothetical protein
MDRSGPPSSPPTTVKPDCGNGRVEATAMVTFERQTSGERAGYDDAVATGTLVNDSAATIVFQSEEIRILDDDDKAQNFVDAYGPKEQWDHDWRRSSSSAHDHPDKRAQPAR